jgi:hypothetical protein
MTPPPVSPRLFVAGLAGLVLLAVPLPAAPGSPAEPAVDAADIAIDSLAAGLLQESAAPIPTGTDAAPDDSLGSEAAFRVGSALEVGDPGGESASGVADSLPDPLPGESGGVEFAARYEHYLEVEERGAAAGVDPVALIEAGELSLAAESLAANGELDPALELIEEAIARLARGITAALMAAPAPRGDQSQPRAGRRKRHRGRRPARGHGWIAEEKAPPPGENRRQDCSPG